MKNTIKKLIEAKEWGVDPLLVDDWDVNTFEYDFFNGVESEYPLCCILWFCIEHNRLGYKIPELSDPETTKTVNWGIERTMCPDCMIKYMGGFNE